ncbi:hypothetical protein [Thauera butanivorans]|uniref:hypothetical protein n=1 Tax=Thauera butanivorans TaxID=86174 RepID=UPI000838F568|nr:hypothetical protein [Thauera butanivorans]
MSAHDQGSPAAATPARSAQARASQDSHAYPPYPPRSLLGVGVVARLGAAALATGLLWLAVLWALD